MAHRGAPSAIFRTGAGERSETAATLRRFGVGRSNEEIVQFRKGWMEGSRYGEMKGYDGPPIPAPQLPPVPLKARGRVR